MTDTEALRPPDSTTRKRRSDGERSRNAILREAAKLATVDGISGLSIGRLADAVGMSKSGLFAHFGSKEELQIATIETARAVFTEQVIEPALDAPNGVERLRSYTEHYFLHISSGIYPGGCFFASLLTEMDTHAGPIRDRAVEVMDGWIALLADAVRDAQAEGLIDAAEDPAQIAFEIEASLFLANLQFVVVQNSTPLDRARRAIELRLAAAAPVATQAS
jgi:AcrR family transcriptional regulator